MQYTVASHSRVQVSTDSHSSVVIHTAQPFVSLLRSIVFYGRSNSNGRLEGSLMDDNEGNATIV
jgi:hypothetical protein